MGPQSHSPCARTRTRRAHTDTDKPQTKCIRPRSGLTRARTANLSSVEQSSRRTVLLSNQHCDFPEKSKTQLGRTAQLANRRTGKPSNRQAVKPSNRQTGKQSNRRTGNPSSCRTGKPSNRPIVKTWNCRPGEPPSQQTPAFYVVPEAPSAKILHCRWLLEFWQARATTK